MEGIPICHDSTRFLDPYTPTRPPHSHRPLGQVRRRTVSEWTVRSGGSGSVHPGLSVCRPVTSTPVTGTVGLTLTVHTPRPRGPT